MTQHRRIGGWIFAFALGAGSLAWAQAALPQLGLTETAARDALLSAIQMSPAGESCCAPSDAVKPFLKLAPAARALAVTGMEAWAKAYVNSATFKKTWAERVAEQKPTAPSVTTSVDDELKAKNAETQKQIDDMKKMIAGLSADQRQAMEGVVTQMEAQAKDPAMQGLLRQAIVGQRAADQGHYQDDLKQWQDEYPADATIVIARHLHAFLTMSAEVNFDAKLETRDGKNYFADPQYESKSAEWKMCFRAGREATSAARAAATAWLKELGK